MRGSVLLALLLPLLAPSEAPSAAGGGLAVLGAAVRFGAAGRAALRVDGDLGVSGSLAALGPREAGFRLALGPAVVLDGFPPDARVRVRRDGAWRIRLRRPFQGKGRLALDLYPGSGTFTLAARGWDGSALLASGPSGVPFSAAAGEFSGEDPVTFEVRGSRWEYRRGPRPRPGGGGGGGGPPPPSGITTLALGASSGITNHRFEVVTDSASWEALWAAHAGSGPAPAVDFAAETVVGIWLGPRPTGGYTATIAGFTPATVLGVPCTETWCPPQGVVVTVIEGRPGGSCAVTQAVSYPFHIVKVPRAEWGGVMVDMSTRVDDCF